ncbi:hypothetical protein SDRG_15031 [Saprolegnia diclina VS20]|uniref:Uncharacterized protein n=1 Tax=Saprolegnia diclina (strain VS20) TaxID=1156394 RepID=T0Q185_SAPDV|nr:hypothetical protein SDRG_15031 [Saprolegnia diclina VS20]EQC27130.1 hypothetical protein SDRG_15031 [Saprolegnia diclina VS20]|eukprot:XP_008619416.1 hypothetical protein SDRG_15031 [Saprolegnia diclina VS20]
MPSMFQTPALQRYLMWNVPITHAAMRKPAPRGAPTTPLAPQDLVTLVTLNITVLSIVHGARLDEHDSGPTSSSHLDNSQPHHRGVMPGVLTPLVASKSTMSAEAGRRPTLRQLRAACTPLPPVAAIETTATKKTMPTIVPVHDGGEQVTVAVDEAPAASMTDEDMQHSMTTDEPTPLEESTMIEPTMLTEPVTTTCCEDPKTLTADEPTRATTLDASTPTPAAPLDNAVVVSSIVAAPALSRDSTDEPDDEEKIAAEPIISAVATPTDDSNLSKEHLVADERSIAGSSTASEDGDDEADRVLSIKVKAPSVPAALPSPIAESTENDAPEPLFSMDLMSDLDDSDGWSVYASSECGTESESVTDTGRSRRRSRIPRPRDGVVQPELQPCLRRNNRSATSLAALEHKTARLESPARARGDVTNRLYNPSYHQERDSKLEQLRAQRELEECTFRPSTNGKPPAPRRRRHRMSI